MHKSRLAGFIIDCRTDDLEQAARFWSQALGYPLKGSSSPEDTGYRLLDTPADDLHIEVQKVEHPSRVHLDIEADDIEAEVKRLEKLGAKRVAQVRTARQPPTEGKEVVEPGTSDVFTTWWVMEAPTGQRFCVVRVQRSDFAANANTWTG